jgi:GTP 3',8-cyclase
LRRFIEQRWTLVDLAERTGGPARYVRVVETGGKIGFITPLTHNFCEDCNRVRVTASGVLHTCLGQANAVDLKRVLRGSGGDAALVAAIGLAVRGKPRGHDFEIGRGGRPSIARHMSATGG